MMLAAHRSLLLVPVLLGCSPQMRQTTSFSSSTRVQQESKPHKVALVDEMEAMTNDKLTKRSFTFDFAGRQPRRIECGGVAIMDGLSGNKSTASTLKFSAQQIAPNRVKVKLEKVFKEELGQTTTSTTSEYEIVGGVGGVKKATEVELNPPSGKTSVLLRWVDARTKQPKTLNAEF
jgi:hypothetical protein